MSKVARTVVVELLKPIAELVLALGVSVFEFEELFRETTVHVAMSKQLSNRARVNNAGISAITGLNRAEIARIVENAATGGQSYQNICGTSANRVLAGWSKDPKFWDRLRVPADLPMYGKGATFQALALRYAPGLPARAILDELLYRKSIEVLAGQKVRAVSFSATAPYIDEESLQYFGYKAANILAEVLSRIHDKKIALAISTASFDGIDAKSNPTKKALKDMEKLFSRLNATHALTQGEGTALAGKVQLPRVKITIIAAEIAREARGSSVTKRTNYQRKR